MPLSFIKYFCIFFCSITLFNNVTQIKVNRFIHTLYPLLLSSFTLLLNYLFPNEFYFFPFFLFGCFIFYYLKNIKSTFIVTVISYGISYALLMACIFLTSTILYFLHYLYNFDYISVLTIFSAILALFITQHLTSVKRFKSGMPFLYSKINNIKGIILATIMFLSDLYIHYAPSNLYSSAALIQFLACLLLIPFIAWWRSQLTKSYRQYLKDAETQELRAKVEQLSEDNQRLSQIVHKDNKLITAMTSSVLNFVEQSPDYSPEHLAAYSQSLHKELLSLSSHRQDSLSRLSGTVTGQFHTGYMMLDSVLNLQAKQAKDCAIAFSVAYNADFFTKVFSFIDEEQLTHIVADLVQNAIIATKEMSNKSVDISFVLSPHAPSIQISDSGESFPIVVLNNLGQQRCSQHLHDGGSGIGLMDIWTLKNTAKATLLIEEFPDGAKFTKRIHLIFDKKNRYLIISDRKEELSAKLHRPDVLLLSSSH